MAIHDRTDERSGDPTYVVEDTVGSSLARGWLWVLGAIFALLGIVLGGGGIWLITLGGSWYYLIAGIGLIASGYYVVRGEMTGFWVYLATWIFTVIWALWEVGLQGWPLVPRLVAPTVLLIVLLLSLPAFGRRVRYVRAAGSTAALALAGISPAYWRSSRFRAEALRRRPRKTSSFPPLQRRHRQHLAQSPKSCPV